MSLVSVVKPAGPCNSITGSDSGSEIPKLPNDGPIPRNSTVLGAVPVMINPPIPTLASGKTRIRVERFSGWAAGVAVGVVEGVGVGVIAGVGVGVPPIVAVAVAVVVTVAVGVAVAAAVAVAVAVTVALGEGNSDAVGVAPMVAVAVTVAVEAAVGVGLDVETALTAAKASTRP